MSQGSFIVSLDFELHWGVRDIVRVSDKRDHFLRAREAIPEVLRLFRDYEIHATWATVGFLFARDKRHLTGHLPELRPSYSKHELDPYPFLGEIGDDERRDPFHYAPSLLQGIADVPGQELASHTFSHYYCLEDGQTKAQFEADLSAAAVIGESFGDVTRAVVFPRGQHNPAYDSVLKKLGVQSYRISPESFAYRPRRIDDEGLPQRAFRLVDSYLPLGGSYVHKPKVGPDGLVALPTSMFLRPYSPSRRKLEPLRMNRIHRAMSSAAEKGLDFHLWWHPHNFGSNTRENLKMLGSVLEQYRLLRDRHGWASRNMSEVAQAAKGIR